MEHSNTPLDRETPPLEIALWNLPQEEGYNTAVGEASLSRNTTKGSTNSSFGSHSLSKNETGNGNSAFGWGALSEITEGGANTALGDHAGWSLTGNSHHNTFVGWNSGVVSGTTDILNSQSNWIPGSGK